MVKRDGIVGHLKITLRLLEIREKILLVTWVKIVLFRNRRNSFFKFRIRKGRLCQNSFCC